MNFDNNFDKYDENAHVQKKVAIKLMSLLPKESYNSIFEIGCGTGILSKEINEKINYNIFFINDKYLTCKKYLNNITYSKFLVGDIKNITIPKTDLVISSSVFQWIEDKSELFKNISTSTSTLIFSIYIENNLKEILDHFGVSLEYNSVMELNAILKHYFSSVSSVEEVFTVEFNTPLEALRHLKNTGVTGFKQSNISKIRSYSEKKLTYRVAYFICKKN